MGLGRPQPFSLGGLDLQSDFCVSPHPEAQAGPSTSVPGTFSGMLPIPGAGVPPAPRWLVLGVGDQPQPAAPQKDLEATVKPGPWFSHPTGRLDEAFVKVPSVGRVYASAHRAWASPPTRPPYPASTRLPRC